jgi:hypothetical protein
MILWFLAYVMLFFHYIRFVGGLPPFVGALSPYADAVLDVKRHLLNEKDRAATCCTAGHWKHQYQSSSWLEIWKRSNGNLQPNSFIILMIILMATRACGRPRIQHILPSSALAISSSSSSSSSSEYSCAFRETMVHR